MTEDKSCQEHPAHINLSPITARAASIEDQASSTVLQVGLALVAAVELVLVGGVGVQAVTLASTEAAASAWAAAAAAATAAATAARLGWGSSDRGQGVGRGRAAWSGSRERVGMFKM